MLSAIITQPSFIYQYHDKKYYLESLTTFAGGVKLYHYYDVHMYKSNNANFGNILII